MARPLFLPSRNAYTTDADGRPQAGIPVRLFTRQVGGTQVTDLVYVGYDGTLGSAVPNGVLVSDGNGLLPAFAGPDNGPANLFGDSGMTGERLALTAGSPSAADLSATFGPAVGSDNWLKAWGSNIDSLIRATTITRSGTDAATGANVVWPDGTAGVYAGTASTGTPGAIDSYTVTYLGSTTKTVTQPTMTRTAGAVTNRPAMTVS